MAITGKKQVQTNELEANKQNANKSLFEKNKSDVKTLIAPSS